MKFAAAALALAVTGMTGVPAAAQSDNFYADKTITIICWSGAGSLYDVNARFLGRHFTRKLPGNPQVIVRNMTGAGGVTATNHLANTAPKDGTTLAVVARGMGIEPLLGGEQTRFDPLKLKWIGSTSPEVSVIAVRSETGVRTLDDLRTREVAVAGPAPGTDGVTYPNTLNNLLGTRFRIVTGYRSGPEMVMAVERREVEGRGSWSWASFRTEGAAMMKAGELQLLVQMSLRKSPELPNVPLVMEYAKTEEQRQILRVILTGQEMAWPLVAPAETPKERVDLLRRTFMAMLADDEAKAEAKKLGVDLEPISGAEIEKLLEGVYATPPAIIERVRELSGRRK
ncbi:MAG: Bug family tripartite tricarboxylate transporter substrate binding protein [Beijerinckiaceae bacterium]